MSEIQTLQVSRILSPVTALGPGRRVGIWVQGCTLACTGCASQDTWSPTGGVSMPVAGVAELLVSLMERDEQITGLAVTGGEPAQQPAALAHVIAEVRSAAESMAREIDVLLFSGYSYPVLARRAAPLVDVVDTIIAGRYRAERGFDGPLGTTANQTIHRVTPLGERRCAPDRLGDSAMQVTMDGDQLLLVGIPRPGDLERMRSRLDAAGVQLRGASWVS